MKGVGVGETESGWGADWDRDERVKMGRRCGRRKGKGGGEWTVAGGGEEGSNVGRPSHHPKLRLHSNPQG